MKQCLHAFIKEYITEMTKEIEPGAGFEPATLGLLACPPCYKAHALPDCATPAFI